MALSLKFYVKILLTGVFSLVYLCIPQVNGRTFVLYRHENLIVDVAIKNFQIPEDQICNKQTLHLVTHGRAGELLINGEWKNAANIADFLKYELGIKNYRKDDHSSFISAAAAAHHSSPQRRPLITHLNIYGCEFAKGQKGLEAVAYLEKTLGVSVSASTNITGKDGDWKLEVGDNVDVLTFTNFKYNLQTCSGTLGGTGTNDDYDGDGYCNSVDLDDDNDGILDTNEMTCPAPLFTGTPTYNTNGTVTTPTSTATISVTSTAPSLSTFVSTNGSLTYTHGEATSFTNTVNVTTTSGETEVVRWGIGAGEYSSSTGYAASEAQTITPTWNGGGTAYVYNPNGELKYANGTVIPTGTLLASGTPIKITTRVFNTTSTWYLDINTGTASTGTFSLSAVSTSVAICCAIEVYTVAIPAYSSGTCADKDTDGDSIPDRFDLDSDGDGCADALEGGAAITTSQLATSTLPGGNTSASGSTYTGTVSYGVQTNLGNSVGSTSTTMGVPTLAGTGQSMGTSQDGSIIDVACCPAMTPPTVSPVSICTGSSTTLTASACTTGTLTWYSNSALTTVLSSTTVSPTTTTTYYPACVYATVCKSSTPLTVTVNALPAAPTASTAASICNGSSTTLTATCAAGTTPKWYTAATGGTVVTNPVSPTVNTTYHASCVDNTTGCESSTRKSVLITVNPLPTITGATSVCAGSTITLTGSATAGTAPSWTSSNTAVATVPSTSTTAGLITGVSVGTTTITYKNSNGCTVTRDITVNATPSAPTVTPATICYNTSTNLQGSCATGTLQWYAAANPTIATATISSNTGALTANKTYYAACVNGGCISASTANLITVNTTIAAPTALSATAICSGGSSTLSGTCASGTTIKWYDAATAGNVVTSPVSLTNTGTTATTAPYYASCVNNTTGCEGTRSAAVNVTVNPYPTITGKTSICSGATTTLTALPTGGTWSSSNTAAATVSAGGVVTGTVAGGTSDILYTVKGCATTQTVTVSTKPSAPTAIVASATTICSGATSSLTSSCSTGTLTWYSDAALTIIVGTGSPLTVSPSSTTIYYASCVNNGCQSASTNTTITVGTIIGNNTGGNTYATNISSDYTQYDPTIYSLAKVFDGSLSTYSYFYPSMNNNSWVGKKLFQWDTPLTVPLTTVVMQMGGTTWAGQGFYLGASSSSTIKLQGSNDGGLTWVDLSVPTNAYSQTSLTLTNTLQPNTAYSSYKIVGVAGNGLYGLVAEVTPTFQATVPTVTGTTTICSGTTSQLLANGVITSSGTWSSATTSVATVSNTGLVTGVSAGTSVITYTNASGCAKTITVTVNALPTITGTTSVCAGSTTQLTGSGTAATSNPWVSASTGVATISSTGLVTGMSAGTSVITYTDNNGCTKTTTVTVTATPTAPTGLAASPAAICEGASSVLSTTACATGTLTWYSDASLTTVITGTSPTVTPAVTTTYYAACVNGSCKSPSANVTVTVTPTPATPTAESISASAICTGQSATLSATCATGTVTWFLSSDLVNPIASPTVSPNPSVATTYTYYVYCYTGVCKGGVKSVKLTVTPTPTAPTGLTASPAAICLGTSSTLSAAACTSGTLTWYSDAGLTTTIAGTSPSVSPTISTTYYAACVNGTCKSPSASVLVTVNNLPNTPNIATPSPICVGQSATLNGSGCPSGTTYVWSTGATGVASITVSPTTTTDYTLQCKDNTTGCVSNSSNKTTVTVNPKPVAPTISAPSSSICNGSSVTITQSGCSGIVKWSNGVEGVSSITVNPTTNTTYTATCTSNATGCVSDASNSVVITVNPKPAPPTVTPIAETICLGSSTTLNASGCSGTVTWNTGQTTASITVSPTVNTSYTATCKDNTTGCESAVSAASTITVVTPPPAPNISATKTTICKGETVTLTITNCSGTVKWLPSGETTSSINVSPAATTNYSAVCTIVGGSGSSAVSCTSPTSTTLTITVNPVPDIPAVSIAPSPICEDQKATLSATGCVGGTIRWSDGQTGVSVSVSPVAGNYTYSATCLLPTGCESKISNEVKLTVNPKPNPPVVSTNATDICLGASATLTAMGCSGTLVWDDGTKGSPRVVSPTTDTKYTATCLSAEGCSSDASNTIVVYVLALPSPPTLSTKTPSICLGDKTQLDASGCSGTVTWSDGQTGASIIINPAITTAYTAICKNTTTGCVSNKSKELLITVNPLPTVKATINSPVCEGQVVNLTATPSGGTPTYTYAWTNGAGYSSTAQNPSFTATLASTGTYVVTLTDKAGCIAKDKVTLEVYEVPKISATTKSPYCEDELIQLNSTVTGGSGSYTYEWSGPNGFASKDPNPTLTATLAAAGTYVLTVTDAKTGCKADYKLSVDVNPRPKITASSNSPVCEGDQIALTAMATGGSGAYNYQWEGPNGFTSTAQKPTLTATMTAAGTYAVIVTDAKTNCSAGVKIEVIVYEKPVIKIESPQIYCEGDKIVLTPDLTGGSGAYTYQWEGPNGFNSTDPNPAFEAIPDASGTYAVTVKDEKTGCSVAVKFDIKVRPKFDIKIDGTTNVCEGQKIELRSDIVGGSGSFIFEWTGPNKFTSSDQNPTLEGTAEASGTYTVTVTDKETGCKYAATIDIKVNPALTVSASSANAKCNGSKDGTATLTVVGGTTPYSYAWSNGAITQNLTGLGAGTYNVTVTDASGVCSGSASVTISEPTNLTATVVKTDLKCYKDKSGKVDLTVTGGTTPYSYAWSNGGTTEDLSGLPIGTYDVNITDANGCKVTASATLAQPDSMIIIGYGTNVKCYGGADGAATHTTTTGGTAPYTYVWTKDGIAITPTTKDLTGLTVGTYGVTMTDVNGCTVKGSFAITQPDSLSIDLVPITIQCNGSTTSVTTNVTGGTQPYQYLWSNGSTASNTSGLAAGTYTLTVTDANGCKKTKQVTLTQPSTIAADFTKVDVLCNGDKTGSITVTASGGTGTLQYIWSDGGSGANRTGLAAGNYSVIVRDANGCETTLNAVISEPTKLAASATATAVKCFGTPTGSIDLTVTGGVKPYAFSWSNMSAIEDPINLVAGTYSVIVSDANGCKVNASVVVTEPQELKASTTQTNVKCAGGKDGAIDLTVTGGTTPYAYTWSNGGTIEDLTSLGAGSYSVTITDKNGCKASAQAVITQPDSLKAIPTITEIKCYGQKASINLTVSGGTTPYSYLWSNAQTTQNITNLSPAIYSVTITDANGCTKKLDVPITQPDSLKLTITSKNLTCNVANNGNINLTIDGGTAPYDVLWNDGATTENRDNLAAGTYNVTVTDVNGCIKKATVIITQPNVLDVKSVVTDVKCNGAATGKIDLTVSGGTTPYKYFWNTAATTEDLSNLTAGSYAVTVTDANGCEQKLNFEIQEPTALKADCIKTDLSCKNSNNGKIDLTVTGGVTPYKYLWNNAATTQNLTNLAAGTYSLTITDANGCELKKQAILTEPDSLKLSCTKIDILCKSAATGAIDLTISGGIAPYKYLWNNSSTTQDQNNLSAGTYTVTVTDLNGCELKKSITLTEPDSLKAVCTKTDILCNGNSTGAINLSVTGGEAPYSYLWSNGYTTQNISNLPAGTYNVTITDANGCTIKKAAVLTEPTLLQATQTTTDVKCFGGTDGSINLTATGGTTPYTYAWSNTATTQNITGLKAGTYSVTVTDKNGCTAKEQTVVAEPDLLKLTLTKDTVSCNGASSGTILSTTIGGTSPYTYLWSNGSTQPSVSGLAAGTYSLVVTDKNGCKASASTTLAEPAKIAPSAKIVDVNCNGGNDGSIDLEVAGGAAPYTYVWSNGKITQDLSNLSAGVYTVKITDNNKCVLTLDFTLGQPKDSLKVVCVKTDLTCKNAKNGKVDLTVFGGTLPYKFLWNNGETTEDISSLNAGNYSVIITDANGCSTKKSVTLTEPDSLIASCVKTDILCKSGKNGAIDLSVSGGTLPYQFLWSNNEITEAISGLSAGTYSVTITDKNGCKLQKEVILTEPDSLKASCFTTNILCNNASTGAIDLTVTGGAAPYHYLWSNAAISQDLTNVSAGTYNVKITDTNGCTLTKTVVLTQPDSLKITVVKTTDVNCNSGSDGKIDISVSGGKSPYSYAWNNASTTEDLSGLKAGVYSVVVTDANGCKATERVVISEPDVLKLSLVKDTVSCNGAASGTVLSTTIGGTSPYTYLWSNGSTQPSVSGLAAGTYTLVVTDKNGCKASASTTLSEPAKIAPSAKIVDVNCNGGNDGSIDLEVAGGASPYTYAWSNGAVTQDLSNLSAGIYTVKITDNNKCTLTLDFTLGQPKDSLKVVCTKTDLTCRNAKNGKIDLTVSGGTLPYKFLWSNGETTQNISSLKAGSYSVIITDANGCSTKKSVTLTEPDSLIASCVKTDILCKSGKNGAIDLSVSGGTLPYQFLWSNGGGGQPQITEDISSLTAGIYSVTITDKNGCKLQKEVILTEPDSLKASCFTTNILCNNASTGAIDLTVTGGAAPYHYLWSNAAISQDLVNVGAGTYNVKITDANGCTLTKSAVLTQPDSLKIVVSSAVDVKCFGGADGSIDISVSGGKSPYSFEWNNASTIEDLSGLKAGVYSVVVTDANGCKATERVVISEPDVLKLSLVKDTVSCNGATSGTVLSTTIGGTSPYTYLWSNGSTQPSVSGLAAGTYTLVVTDKNGCKASASTTLAEPAKIAPSAKIVDVNCNDGNDGSIDLEVAGGAAPYTYAWSNGASSQDLTALTAGVYTVKITDNNKCVVRLDFTLGQPKDSLKVVCTKTDLTCKNAKNGKVDLTVFGGTLPYKFLWNNGETTEDISSLNAGNYSVIITDANGCSTKKSVTLTEPDSLIASCVKTDILCKSGKNGAIDLSVSGGTLPYQFLWSNNEITEDVSGLTAGTYSVTISDKNGCKLQKEVILTEPDSLKASCFTTNILCNNASTGAIDLTVTGGAVPYHYLWSNAAISQDITNVSAGTYNVKITDANGCTLTKSAVLTQPDSLKITVVKTTDVNCNSGSDGKIDISVSGGKSPYSYAWNNASTAEDLSGLKAGVYSVVVTDANGCKATERVVISEPDLLKLTLTKDTVSCNGAASGTVLSTTIGGTSPYTYLWSNGSTQPSVSGLAAGTYSLVVTDKNGCKASASTTLAEPAKIAPSAKIVDVNCNGGNDGSIDLEVAGGAAPYTYAWSNGGTTQDLTGLSAGVYTVKITDNNKCVLTLDFTLGQPKDSLKVVCVKTDLACKNAKNGKVDLTVSGGTLPYKFLWSNGETTEDISTLSAGNYSVIITDANGCSTKKSVTLTEPDSLIASCLKTEILCKSGKNGAIDLSVSGGTLSYQFLWSNSEITEDISGLSAGTYSVTITDKNGCKLQKEVILTEPDSLKASCFTTNILCNNASTGAIDLTVTGGAAPYHYLWSNAAISQDLVNVSAGTYNVKITDANGCTLTKAAVLTQPDSLKIVVSSATDVKCFGGADGSIDISVSGGKSPYSYAWNNASTTEDLTGLKAGVYSVVVTDANGCKATERVVISEPDILKLSLVKDTVSCNGAASGTVLSTTIGGTSPYTYLWSNGSTQPSVSGLAAGSYTLVVTDKNGCKANASTILAEPAKIAPSAKIKDVNCNGGNDGSIDLEVAGGAAPYTYAWNTGVMTQDLTNLSAGIYTVKITDNNKCVLTLDFTLGQPKDSLKVVCVKTDLTCKNAKNGKVDLTVSGGTLPYKFLWNNGETTQNLTNLAAGTYSLLITDANGCTAKKSVTLTEPDSAYIKVLFSACSNNTYSVRVQASGGTFSSNVGTVTDEGQNIYFIRNIADTSVAVLTLKSVGGCEAIKTLDKTICGISIFPCSNSPAGPNAIICEPTATHKLPKPRANGYWVSLGSNPSAATIDTSGNVMGLTKNGTYNFMLIIPSENCVDTVTITRIATPTFEAAAISTTCTNGNNNVDAKIVLTGFTANLNYDIVEGASYTLSNNYSTAKAISTDGVIMKNMANPATDKTFTIRVFNANNCYKDMTVTLKSVTCGCPPQPCVPISVKRKTKIK